MAITGVIQTNQQLAAKVQQTGKLIPVKATIGATTSIGDLSDVSEPASPETNSTLVYNSSTQLYVVKKLDLDGGTF